MKCKNIECQNETKGKNLYCSLTCRNVYVNKYMRNYDKVSDFHQKKKQEKETEYLKNPKLCKHCQEIISYNNRENKYCNQSCSAKHTNPLRKGIKHNMSKEGCNNNIIKANSLRRKNFINCIHCNKETNNIKFCCRKCQNDYYIELYKEDTNKSFSLYKTSTNFKFNLANFKDEFDFSLIKEHGWYSPTNKNNNLGGISRDHMFSVREGFELGINPKLLAHPANCKLMIHNENISKNKSSSITYEELLERIKYFNQKYNLVEFIEDDSI